MGFDDAVVWRPQERAVPEPDHDIRSAYQRDIDRITHSKSFRRLMHKTQVFLNPEGDHYRTRMTHTLEVSRIARTMARALFLDEDLTEAVALGHDLGHTPFGHAGESALDEMTPGGFSHRIQSLRVVERLEQNGRGLNLTNAVRDGILRHSGPEPARTPEGKLVHLADRIAYLNHDMDDALRAGLLSPDEVPPVVREVLGGTPRERIDNLVRDVVRNGEPAYSPACGEAMDKLREFMFTRLYRHSEAKSEESRAKDMLKRMFGHYTQYPGDMPMEFLERAYAEGIPRAVCDYVAGMTDRYAVAKAAELFIPKGWERL
jgi:dGTPase